MTQAEDYDKSGRWEIIVKNKLTGDVSKTIFDAVLVCTGHHAEKNVPTFPGLDKFKGKVSHSHDYKDFHGYEGQRVVVVGIGNSGGDIAVELSRTASQVGSVLCMLNFEKMIAKDIKQRFETTK